MLKKLLPLLLGGLLYLPVLYAQAPPPYPSAPAAPGNVMKAEYFIDTDPGFGNGTNIPLTAALNLPALAASINTGALSTGVHRIYVRTRSAEGRWSVTSSRLFSVEPNYPAAPAAATNVNKAEYFIDTDPGFGLGTNISLTAALDLPALVASINTTFLSAGIHRLYVRTRNASGRWGVTSSRLFAVAPGYPASPAAPGNVTKAEYFIDTDPGFGLGTNIPLTAALNIPALAASISTGALSTGIHRLYVRTQNANGRWSETSSRLFAVAPAYTAAPAAPTNVNKAEYFFDADPGFGLGTNIPLTAGTDIPSLSATLSTGALSTGIHRMYTRTRSASGRWSETSSKLFAVIPNYPVAPAAVGNINKAEYFIDTDPGFGLGTNIPLTAATNIPALIASINTASLTAGVHRLYVRTRSAAGRWSETSSLLFATFPGYPATPAAPGNITRIEYFFDVDPGFGNGVSVPITPGVQISNLSFPVNTSALTAGTHRLFVRSKDDWGLTSVKVLQVNNWVLPLDLLRFDGRKAGQQVDLEWETTNEENTAYFDIERSRNGVEFEPIGQVEAVNKPGQHQYPFSDLNPFNGLNYYRLKQFDLDGKSTYSKVISVLFSNYGESAIIYPNPATNRLYIETNYDGTREITLQVYDMSGRQVMHKSIPDSKSKITLDIQSLAPGHYTLQCSDGREVISGRFTKQ